MIITRDELLELNMKDIRGLCDEIWELIDQLFERMMKQVDESSSDGGC